MRIIGGTFRGFPLLYPKDRGFRPTQDKVKAAIFNILRDRISGASFLDLCCGTGAMGFEALSRGARSATFVDLDVTFVKKNRDQMLDRVPAANRASLDSQLTIMRSSLAGFLKKSASFDIIFLDPPWDLTAVYDEAFALIAQNCMLAPNGLLVCEHPVQYPMALPDGLVVGNQYRYRRTIISLISCEGAYV